MVRPDQETSHSDPAAAIDDHAAERPGSVNLALPPERIGRLLIFAAVAGLLAGLASEFICERIMNSYHTDLNPPVQQNPNPEDVRRMREARVYSATLTFTALGGLLGLALGLAGGMARRSVVASSSAAILGLTLGSAAAGSLSLALASYFYKYLTANPQYDGLLLPLFTHSAIWSAVGGVGGVAFGLGIGGRGRWKATLGGGVAGAVAAAVIYELVGAVAFASSKTDMPLSSSATTRAMALLLVASLSSIGAVLALREPTKREAKTAVTS